jgi:glc operon protein GlcG
MAEHRGGDRRARVPHRVMCRDIAEQAVQAAQAKARELGITMSIAVVDESGNLVYFVRGDTCSFHTFDTARGKAVAAAAFRRPTHDMQEGYRSNPAFWAGLAAQLSLVPGDGGHPLTRDGVMIGGIGCGGGIGEEDHLCSEAGARAINT